MSSPARALLLLAAGLVGAASAGLAASVAAPRCFAEATVRVGLVPVNAPTPGGGLVPIEAPELTAASLVSRAALRSSSGSAAAGLDVYAWSTGWDRVHVESTAPTCEAARTALSVALATLRDRHDSRLAEWRAALPPGTPVLLARSTEVLSSPASAAPTSSRPKAAGFGFLAGVLAAAVWLFARSRAGSGPEELATGS
jgi:hypothetical protein